YGAARDAHGRPCYAMRFVRGETLSDAIKRFHAPDAPCTAGERRLAFRQLLQHFLVVCKTTAYAHSRGIIHRDLKPANIMLGKYGETLVVDWGLARHVGRTEEAGTSGEETLAPASDGKDGQTGVGAVVGTPAYMSPEQAEGRREVGPASDVYALGA